MKTVLFMLLFMYKTPVFSQEPVLNRVDHQVLKTLNQIANQYGKANPYRTSFSSFINSIITDSEISDRQILKKTDTSFFFTSGTYKSFKPLGYLPSNLKIIVSEAALPLNDSGTVVDTVFYYQLLLSTDGTEKGKVVVEKEFDKLLEKYKRQIKTETYLLSNGVGAAAACFFTPYAVAPLTLGWGFSADQKAYVLNITFCLKMRNNTATMVLLPNEFYLKD